MKSCPCSHSFKTFETKIAVCEEDGPEKYENNEGTTLGDRRSSFVAHNTEINELKPGSCN